MNDSQVLGTRINSKIFVGRYDYSKYIATHLSIIVALLPSIVMLGYNILGCKTVLIALGTIVLLALCRVRKGLMLGRFLGVSTYRTISKRLVKRT